MRGKTGYSLLASAQRLSNEWCGSISVLLRNCNTLLVVTVALTVLVLLKGVPLLEDFVTRPRVLVLMVIFVFFGAIYMPSGPFTRPHPIFWKAIFCIHFVYTLLAAALLSTKNVDEARKFMAFFYPSMGQPLPEKHYAEDCRLYTPGHPDGDFQVLMDKIDFYVPAHFIGWIVKAIIVRDYFLLLLMSVGFELLEYTLEPQLPNFGECWWDHWILDALLCNGLGSWLGMRLAAYLKLKKYNWTALWKTQTHLWPSFLQFLCVCLVPISVLMAELNSFYLKSILWIPQDHEFIVCHSILFSLCGSCAVCEVYNYLSATNEHPSRVGSFLWLVLSSLVCESLIAIKFGWYILAIPLHSYAYIGWSTGLVLFLLWSLWNFTPIHSVYTFKHQ